ncbi:hypothetical protein IW16_17365 [Chryseobacterium vrystaatense]|nr:hypothetical protein IW16_17365 [Chryseobacterium vrystaatense]
MCTIQSINNADQQKTHARDCMANDYLLTYKFKKMKTLNVSQMEVLKGANPGTAFSCGVGVGIAIGGFAATGGLSLLALALCINGDS